MTNLVYTLLACAGILAVILACAGTGLILGAVLIGWLGLLAGTVAP